MTDKLDPDTAFLFDVGNVILFFDFGRLARAIESECDCSAEQLLELIEAPKQEFEGSFKDVDRFLKQSFELIGYRGTREKFVRAWEEIFTLNEPIADWIGELAAAGHPLFLLSNTNQLHADHFLTAYPVFSRFDGWVLSHEAGCAKPDPEIYTHAIEKLDLDPARTIYLDDLKENIEEGQAAGFRSILYSNQSPAEVVRQAFADG
ncbi:MAG: HAD superfamily hydrolase (TIGR01509 family) [Verrucomicrobiales bacterium]|jgi:HAD superfamily hydrolase (TIGR01509 family)